MVMRAILTFCLPQVFSPFFLSFGEKIFVGSERKTPPNLIKNAISDFDHVFLTGLIKRLIKLLMC